MIQVEPQVVLTSATASFKFTYKATSDVEDLSLPHMHTHTHTHTHDTHMRIHTHAHEQLC